MNKTFISLSQIAAFFVLPSHGICQEDATIKSLEEIAGLPRRIAFGSCASENKPQPVLDTVRAREPDVFIYLGDNIYGDTRDMDVLKSKYDKLGSKPEFKRLRKNIPILSIWDDHDFGENDAGKEYPHKAESKQIFMDFWRVPDNSPRRGHDGIYGSHRFIADDRVLQIILLDTRTFRDPLKRNNRPPAAGFKNDYQPDSDDSKTLLGAVQWRWLEEQFRQAADVRIVCSSIQFGHEYNGWESWTNLPNEQQRMVDLIKNTKAGGIIFISGDVHWGEISKREFAGCYPLYDITSSGLTEEWYNVEPNKYRVGDAVRENHFGLIEIDWKQTDPEITFGIINVANKLRTNHQIELSEIGF